MELFCDNDNLPKAENDNASRFPPVGLIEETEESSCRTMWIAVIIQALIDAGGKNCDHLSTAKAREWLEGRGGIHSDFAAVCDLAGLDFKRTHDRCALLIQGEAELPDFRCMKKPVLQNRMNENRKRYYQRVSRNARLRTERLARNQNSTGAPAGILAVGNRLPSRANDNSNNQPMERVYEQQAN